MHAHPLSQSFGKLEQPALALFSEKDEYAHIPDIKSHLAKWEKIGKGKLSTAIVPGATHAVDDEKLWPLLTKEVVGWLQKNFE